MRALPLAAVPVGLALGLYAEWAALKPGPFEAAASASEKHLALADLVAGLILVGCGAAAWAWRRASWTGPLLVLAGLAWFLGTFAASGDSGYADFGALFVTLHRGPLVHALLSYPTGRLERRRERAVVGTVYVLAAVADVGTTPEAALAVAVLLVGFAVARVVQSAGPTRRARAVAALTAGAFAAVLPVAGVNDLLGGSGTVDSVATWAYDVIVAGVGLALALDLLLRRWVRATVAGLVVDLGVLGEAGTLRARLADALGDRSLVLAYRLAERDAWVDERGVEVRLPHDDGERRVTIVREGGQPVAALVHDPGVFSDPELVDSVAAAARIAVSNARLQAEVRRQLDELEASRRRVVEAGDAERRRLEGELRQGAERRLTQVEALLDGAGGANGPVAATLAETRAEVERARAELREFARGVHPRVLTEGGLAAALRELAERSAVPVDVDAPDFRFPAAVEAAAYFVCAEALANVGKYAAATSVSIDVDVRAGTLIVAVRDDGRGGATLDGGSGLRGLADRVEALGGRVTLRSPPGRGTRLVAELPLS